MRYDYDYIKSAVGMGLATTKKGDEFCDEDGHEDDPLREFLLFVQDAGLVLPNRMTIVDGVHNHEKAYGDFRTPAIVIMRAIMDGYVETYMHIWDEPSLRCRLHGILDDTMMKSIPYHEDKARGAKLVMYVDDKMVTVVVRRRMDPPWDPWEVKGFESVGLL
jgi:hypothetical protein